MERTLLGVLAIVLISLLMGCNSGGSSGGSPPTTTGGGTSPLSGGPVPPASNSNIQTKFQQFLGIRQQVANAGFDINSGTYRGQNPAASNDINGLSKVLTLLEQYVKVGGQISQLIGQNNPTAEGLVDPQGETFQQDYEMGQQALSFIRGDICGRPNSPQACSAPVAPSGPSPVGPSPGGPRSGTAGPFPPSVGPSPGGPRSGTAGPFPPPGRQSSGPQIPAADRCQQIADQSKRPCELMRGQLGANGVVTPDPNGTLYCHCPAGRFVTDAGAQ